jgi:hypothetical protein
MDGLLAPEFLPCFEDTVLVPAGLYMTDLAKALPKGQAVNVVERQLQQQNRQLSPCLSDKGLSSNR